MTGNSVVEAEAELQARLEGRIRAALPLLPAQVQLERSLHLRLGHHAVVIDGLASDKTTTRGRYDVLVRSEGKPLLIAELKAPGVALAADDIAQALSYARLHEPMVPLVLVTNGDTTWLRRTYDGEELQPDDIAAERLTSVLTAATALAASASEDAVRTLLGGSSETWSAMLSAWSQEAIETLTGPVRDLSRPIARGLRFRRDAAKEVAEFLLGGGSVVVVHGPPLCGVTHVLAQIGGNPALGPSLFVDAAATPDVLQFVANRMSRELSFGVSKDDLRGWLNTSGALMGVTLVVDGLPREGVDELVENASAGLLRLAVGMDSETFRRNSSVPGRSQLSHLGRVARPVEIQPLSDAEFVSALEMLDDKFDALFFNGAQHAPQWRWPRALRSIAATLPSKSMRAEPKEGFTSKFMLHPIPGPALLVASSEAFASEASLKFDLGKLAKAYLVDVQHYAGGLEWLVATWGRPSIDPGVLEDELGSDRVERLRAQGFVSWIDTKELGPRVLVRVEELLGHHVAEQWSGVLSKVTDPAALSSEVERLLGQATVIPAGDVILAASIIRAAEKNDRVLSVAVPMLMKSEPTTSRLQEGASVELLVKHDRIRLHFGSGMDEEVVGNLLPWLVLSHIASWPIAIGGYERTMNFSIFADLGCSPHLIYQPPPAELARVAGFHTHDIEGIGSVTCIKTGIVEPLLQAMLSHAHALPDEHMGLAEVAMEKKDPHLAWRVLTVALAAQSSSDPAVEEAATAVASLLKDWWQGALKAALHVDGESGRESAGSPPDAR